MAKWTEAQRLAVTARDVNLLVSAGAGAGKTAVLVERITQRLLDPAEAVEVDKLLVVTFTNAAATEMRERIAGALHAELRLNPTCDRLRRQVALLGKANITTLHSFCLEILRQNFYLLDLDPSFRVADEAECALMQADVLEQVLEQSYSQLDPAFMALVEGFGGRNSDEGLQQLIADLANFALSQPKPRQWLASAIDGVQAAGVQAVESSPWFGGVCMLVRRELLYARDCLARALAVAEAGPTHYVGVITQELEAHDGVCAATVSEWDKFRARVMDITFDRLPAKRGYDAPDKEVCRTWRDEAKSAIKDLLSGLLAQSAGEIVAGLQLVSPQMQMLGQLVAQYLELYGQVKRARGVVDFSDLEHMALAVLSDGQNESGVAEELRARFVEVLVDEYQDINAVQEAILKSVSRDNNMVMVGDVKQSIYRFRLADPGLFRGKEREFSRDTDNNLCLYLAHNFRSRPAVIAAVNHLFRQLMSDDSIGEVAYDGRAELVAAAEYPEEASVLTPCVEVCLLDRRASDTPEGELDVTTREARAIAEQIVSLVDGKNKVWDVSLRSYRPLQYRDIVVLQRAVAGRAEVFLDVFSQRSIPAFAETSGGYFRSTEVHVLMSLLKVIDNPRQDIPLAGVLRSPLVGLDASELAEIRLADKGAFWDAVMASSRATTSIKLKVFLAKLEHWRDMARRGGLPELVQEIYRDTGYFLYVGTLPCGRQRQANLRALLDRSYQFEATSYKGLFRFLRFIERLEEREGDLGKPNTCGENDNVVRVMTVHKSKGLEFPVVFVAGLGNKFNLRDLSGHVLVHRELGLGPKVVDVATRCVYPSLPNLYLRDVLRRESLSEELRVLYVALTRAREKLYLVGAVNKREEAILSWRDACLDTAPSESKIHKRLPPATMERAQNYWDWLGPALYTHVSIGGSVQGSPAVSFANISSYALSSADGSTVSPSPVLAAVAELKDLPEGPYSEEVKWRLGYRYPFAASTQLAAKMTVSEIKRRQMTEEEGSAGVMPVVLRRVRQHVVREPSELTAAEIGAAIHMMMQHVDLKAPLDLRYFESLRQELVKRQLLTSSEAGSIALEPVALFFAGSLGQRLLASRRVWRELPFSLRVPAHEIHPAARDEFIYVQGVIDCLFSEGDALILVDYKADSVTEDSVSAVAERYRAQIDLYTRATEALFRRTVAQRYIYFFALGRALVI